MIAASNFLTNQTIHNGNIINEHNLSTSSSSSTTTATPAMSSTTSSILTNNINNIENNNSESLIVDNHNENNVHIVNNLNHDNDNNNNNNNNDILIENDQNNHENNVDEDENDESLDITISNVVTNFNVRCHLNLRQLATTGSNVSYIRERSIVLMKLRDPPVTATIWSSGKITCTGSKTEESAKRASRKVARCLQRLGYSVRFTNYKVVNVLGACHLPFGIKIHEFSDYHKPIASYEPELHPGATYRMGEFKAVLTIFQTGSITITAPSIMNVQLAVEKIYPLVYEYRKPKLNQNNIREFSNYNHNSINYNNNHDNHTNHSLFNNNNHYQSHNDDYDDENDDDDDGDDIP